MKEYYCSYGQAVKLKEMGFCGEVTGKYSDCPNDPTLFHGMLYQSWNLAPDEILAPRLDQAQKWLREVKHIYVYPEINCLKKWFAKAVDMERNEDLIWDGSMFDTYEDALSYGIDEALTILTNQP